MDNQTKDDGELYLPESQLRDLTYEEYSYITKLKKSKSNFIFEK